MRYPLAAFLLATLIGIVFGSESAKAQNQCDAVLSERLLNKTLASTSTAIKYIYAQQYSEMTYSEFQKETSAGGKLGIAGFSIGGEYDQEEFETWKRNTSNNINLDFALNHKSSLMLSSANPAAIEAWSKCMSGRKNAVRFELTKKGNFILTLKVFADPVDFEQGRPKFVDDPFIDGATLVSGAQFIENGADLYTVGRVVTLRRDKLDSHVTVTLNTTAGGSTAFSPGLIHLPEIVDWDRVIDPVNDRLFRCTRNDKYVGKLHLCDDHRVCGSKPELLRFCRSEYE